MNHVRRTKENRVSNETPRTGHSQPLLGINNTESSERQEENIEIKETIDLDENKESIEDEPI
jgi:hypothetical protein